MTFASMAAQSEAEKDFCRNLQHALRACEVIARSFDYVNVEAAGNDAITKKLIELEETLLRLGQDLEDLRLARPSLPRLQFT